MIQTVQSTPWWIYTATIRVLITQITSQMKTCQNMYFHTIYEWETSAEQEKLSNTLVYRFGLKFALRGGINDSIIALRFQPIRSRRKRWLFLNNHLLKMNNHLPLQFTPRNSVSWMACCTMTCICFGCSALPPRFSEFIYRSIATS